MLLINTYAKQILLGFLMACSANVAFAMTDDKKDVVMSDAEQTAHGVKAKAKDEKAVYTFDIRYHTDTDEDKGTTRTVIDAYYFFESLQKIVNACYGMDHDEIVINVAAAIRDFKDKDGKSIDVNNIYDIWYTKDYGCPEFYSISPDTLLHRAAEKGHDLIVKILLAAGEKRIDDRGDEGRTALDCAIKHRHQDVAIILIDANASITHKGISGSTVLHRAAAQGLDKVVAKLCAVVRKSDEPCGNRKNLAAFVNQTDNDSKIALDYAIRNGGLGCDKERRYRYRRVIKELLQNESSLRFVDIDED